MAQIIMIMISTTLARRDMRRKKNLCTSPNLHGKGQLGEHMFGGVQGPEPKCSRARHRGKIDRGTLTKYCSARGHAEFKLIFTAAMLIYQPLQGILLERTLSLATCH